MQYEGKCLCGQVVLKTVQPCHEITACHCMMCQKWNGGPLMSFIVENGLCIVDKSNVNYFRSSEWAERAFCNKCDTRLFFKGLKTESYYVNAALFDESKTGFLVTQLYVDCKPMHYNFIEKTTLLTEQDILNTYK